MNSKKAVEVRASRRRLRAKSRLHGTKVKPRLVVFRSNKHTYAQLVDDQSGRVLAGCSTLSPQVRSETSNGMKKTEAGKLVGLKLAEKAGRLGVTQVVFDRSRYLYHGRIKALADSARQAGLKF
jgi:large subunit ribosomal protein L18